MELSGELLEQIAFNSRATDAEHMLIVTDTSRHQGVLSQLVQTIWKQFHLAVKFLTGYNGFFNVTSNKSIFLFKTAFADTNFKEKCVPPRAYELESSN